MEDELLRPNARVREIPAVEVVRWVVDGHGVESGLDEVPREIGAGALVLGEGASAGHEAQAEVERWSGILGQLGVDIPPDELTVKALEIGAASTRFRRTFLKPSRPFRTLTGTGQAWGLFTYPDPYPGRLVVEGGAIDRPRRRFRPPRLRRE